jgi:hypothetical protein
MNRTNGAILATLNAGGGDQIEYDAATNRYYNAGSRWQSGGINKLGGGCSATNLCSPARLSPSQTRRPAPWSPNYLRVTTPTGSQSAGGEQKSL